MDNLTKALAEMADLQRQTLRTMQSDSAIARERDGEDHLKLAFGRAKKKTGHDPAATATHGGRKRKKTIEVNPKTNSRRGGLAPIEQACESTAATKKNSKHRNKRSVRPPPHEDR